MGQLNSVNVHFSDMTDIPLLPILGPDQAK